MVEDPDHDFDKTRMPPNILKGIALLFLKIWKTKKKKSKSKRKRSKSGRRSKSRSKSRSRKSKSRKSRSSKRSKSSRKSKSKSKSRKRRKRTKKSSKKLYASPAPNETLQFEQYGGNTAGPLTTGKIRRSKNTWEDNEPIFRSPGNSPERYSEYEGSSPNKRSVNFADAEKEVIQGPTLEDTYSIPKKRKKVKKRVPKKTKPYGSKSKRSKSRSVR